MEETRMLTESGGDKGKVRERATQAEMERATGYREREGESHALVTEASL